MVMYSSQIPRKLSLNGLLANTNAESVARNKTMLLELSNLMNLVKGSCIKFIIAFFEINPEVWFLFKRIF
jgi:hypothetical protein